MHWVVIIVLCAQALALVFLVSVQGWSVLPASLTIIGLAASLGVVIVAGVLLAAPLQFRQEFLQLVRDTILDDLRDVMRWIRRR